MQTPGYQLVQLKNGVHSVRSLAEHETFHPVIGPVAEAEGLYVQQTRLRERLAGHEGEFIVWDVGLGSAANVLTVLRATQEFACPLRILSFDHTLAPLAFGLENAAALGYFHGYEDACRSLVSERAVDFTNGAQRVQWSVHVADFPTALQQFRREPAQRRPPAPHVLLFDAFSPAKNPAMWTLPLFADLFASLDPHRPCSMPTYSRATILRVTLLLAGFFVGRGHATGEKEETTIAANDLALLAEPLDRTWLQRAHRSTSAEPMREPVYQQRPLAPETWAQLQAHPQFAR